MFHKITLTKGNQLKNKTGDISTVTVELKTKYFWITE